jgi:hypothetical protein
MAHPERDAGLANTSKEQSSTDYDQLMPLSPTNFHLNFVVVWFYEPGLSGYD